MPCDWFDIARVFLPFENSSLCLFVRSYNNKCPYTCKIERRWSKAKCRNFYRMSVFAIECVFGSMSSRTYFYLNVSAIETKSQLHFSTPLPPLSILFLHNCIIQHSSVQLIRTRTKYVFERSTTNVCLMEVHTLQPQLFFFLLYFRSRRRNEAEKRKEEKRFSFWSTVFHCILSVCWFVWISILLCNVLLRFFSSFYWSFATNEWKTRAAWLVFFFSFSLFSLFVFVQVHLLNTLNRVSSICSWWLREYINIDYIVDSKKINTATKKKTPWSLSFIYIIYWWSRNVPTSAIIDCCRVQHTCSMYGFHADMDSEIQI